MFTSLELSVDVLWRRAYFPRHDDKAIKAMDVCFILLDNNNSKADLTLRREHNSIFALRKI